MHYCRAFGLPADQYGTDPVPHPARGQRVHDRRADLDLEDAGAVDGAGL